MNNQIFRAAIFCMAVGPAFADDLTPLPAPDPRPYPYKILDLQPGQIATETIPELEEHLGGSLNPKVIQQVVTSPDGLRFEADITIGYDTAGIGLRTRMGNEPYEEITLRNSTPVLEGRLIGLWRTMRKPNAELPDPAALAAQIEELYGKPSWAGADGLGGRMVKYVWTPSGQLSPQEEEPCTHLTYQGYAFDSDRRPVAPPECSAVFTARYETEAGQSTIRFSLVDYELAREDLEETDRQILEQISGDSIEPSDMKL
ncbi:hypothetical protein [Paracoccus methylarcula]|uniref:Uncharacterized protein n=1 Tax=Paracoccus methylarcula TaxID=72022 RepID=A0A3R7M8M2_9RHOB|nr:hypothetical protein [Paracoccus methylarcula]RNF34040.1 hypothetical protein A7A09_014185 [Paracoccus methylarcula]